MGVNEMAMMNPYENLAAISAMQKQALEDLYYGRIVPEGMVPTASLVQDILAMAPKVNALYRDWIGEDWVKQYLPAAGSTITSPMRQALLEYERNMTPLRGGLNPQSFASMYSTPAGIPTLNTRLQEAGHTAWELGQMGQWLNPATGRIEITPRVRSMFAEGGIPIFEAAGGAPPVGRPAQGAVAGSPGRSSGAPTLDYNKLIGSLSNDNPYKSQIQSVLNQGWVPTANLIGQAIDWQNKANQKADKEPSPQQFGNALAALAAEYDDPAEFQQHLMLHYAELVPIIGENAFRDLYMNAAQWVGRAGQTQQSKPAPMTAAGQAGALFRNVFGKRQTKEPGIDAIGEFIRQMRSAGLWPVGVGGGGSK